MNVVWYYSVKGVRTGPVEWSVLRDAIREGKVGPDDYVWTPGYGSEWRKASTFSHLFPNPEGEAKSTEEPRAKEPPTEEIPAPREPGERSPFAPREPDGRKPERVRVYAAYSQAFRNLCTVLFAPFSFLRYIAFALATFLCVLGSQSELRTLVASSQGANNRPWERLELGDVYESPLFGFANRWTDGRGALRPDAAAKQEEMLADLGNSLRDFSRRMIAWSNGKAGSHAGILCFIGILLAILAALCAWFSARGRLLLIAQLYRRDAPVFFTWVRIRRTSGLYFRALFFIRLAFAVVYASYALHYVVRFASIPDAEAVAPGLLAEFVFIGSAISLFELILGGFIRDFVTPHLLLGKPSFRVAFGTAVRDLGFWFVRYLLLLWLFSGIVAVLLVPLLTLSPLLFSLAAAPFFLWRSLWALGIVFRRHPDLRYSVPPLDSSGR